MLFLLFYFVSEGNFQVQALIFGEGYLCCEFEELVFGGAYFRNFTVQSNLDYPDLDYPDYSIIRTFFSGPNFFMNIN